MLKKILVLKNRIIEEAKILDRKFLFWPLFILLLYAVVLILFRSSGSFQGDEAIYSQIARESIKSGSYLSLYWQDKFWFEKPPLIIWFTILSFRIFGVSEISSHLVSGIFGMAGAIGLYFFSLEFFKKRLAAFLAVFIFLTTPIILWSIRSDMMDLPVGFFILGSLFAFWKVLKGNPKWWILFGIFSGLAVMTKSVVGFLPFVIATIFIFLEKKENILKEKYFWQGLGVCLLIFLPWHLLMSVQHGNLFWQDYFGYHVWKRFSQPILNTSWNDSYFSYILLFFERSGVWSLMFVVAMLFAFTKDVRKKYGEKIKFLLIWILTIFFLFTFAKTKLPQYIIPLYFPVAIFLGGMIAEMIRNKKWQWVLIMGIISLGNFLPSFSLKVSNFGEAHIFVPKFFSRFLGFSDIGLIYVFVIGAVVFLGVSYYFRKNLKIIMIIATGVIVGMNVIVPFHPNRNDFIKKLGLEISQKVDNVPVNLYLIKKPEHFSTGMILPFYLPLVSKVDNLGEREIVINNFTQKERATLCFFEKDFVTQEIRDASILSYDEGDVVPCEIKL